MDERLRGFGGNAYTPKIRPDQEELLVPGNILTLVPYFKKALSSGSFTESTTKTFELLDDDPKAVADVLYYTYTGQVKALPKLDDPDFGSPEHLTSETYLRAYIVADKYKAEATMNKLVDALITDQCQVLVNPGSIWILSNAGLRNTPLYTLLLHEMYENLRNGQYHGYSSLFLQSDDEKTTFEQAMFRWCEEDLRQLALIANVPYLIISSPMLQAEEELCEYHKHDLTPKCNAET